MLNEFIAFVKANNLIDPGTRSLLAVSGGVDSVVMADLFYRAGLIFSIAHVNFLLRGDESGRDEAFVKKLAAKYNVEIFVKHFETEKFARRNKISVQVAARQLRYEWFDELLLINELGRVATAHHLDDQIETFLINLARGTGIAGLHGIPVSNGKIIRPLMFACRNEIIEYATDHKLDFVEDSSNLSEKYTRNRIRHKVLPQLEKINPSYRRSINDAIGNIRNAEMIYRQAVAEKRNAIVEENQGYISIPVIQFFNLEPFATWAYELLSPYGFNRSNIRDISGLKDAIPGKEILSATHRLVKDRGRLIIVPRESSSDQMTYNIAANDLRTGITLPIHLTFEILDDLPEQFDDSNSIVYLDMEKLEFPLQIRKWKRGDYFFPLGMTQRKKLSDFFTDLKLSKIDKENQWLLCSANRIVWIIGKRIDDRLKILKKTKKILKIRVHHS